MQQAAESGADATRDAAANPFLSLFQPSGGASTGASAEPATSGAPNVAPLPNPWAPPASGGLAASAPVAGARRASCAVRSLMRRVPCCARSSCLAKHGCPTASVAAAGVSNCTKWCCSGGMPDFSHMMGAMGGGGGLATAGAADAGGQQGMLQMLENPQMQEQMAQMLAMPGFMVRSSMLAVAGSFAN